MLDAGIYKGKRQFVPIDYRALGLVTAKETMAAFGAAFEGQPDMATFTQQMETITSRYGQEGMVRVENKRRRAYRMQHRQSNAVRVLPHDV